MPTCRSHDQFGGSKFIFVHVPKTAGMSMTAALAGHVEPYENDPALRESIINRSYDLIGRYQGVLFWHITINDLLAFYGEDHVNSFYSFAFIRNPWDWLVSMYFFIREHKAHPESMICSHMSFKQFLRFFASKNVTQSTFLKSGGRVAVTEIFRFEDLPDSLEKISQKTGLAFTGFPEENASQHEDYANYYDEEDIEFVRTRFADDVELGGYDFDMSRVPAISSLEGKSGADVLETLTAIPADAVDSTAASHAVMSEKKKKLILHVGTHKTGTTAIQTRLQALAEDGGKICCIPPAGDFYALMDAMVVSDSLVSSIREYVSRAAASQHVEKFVVSFEGFSGNPFLGYPNVDVIAESLFKALADLFEIEVVIYIRRQDHFIESIYSQVAKSIVPPAFSDFLTSLPHDSFRWDEFIDVWCRQFGRERLKVRLYSKAMLDKRGGIFASFLADLGVEAYDDLDKVRVDNPSLSRKAIDIAKMVSPRLNEGEILKFRGVLEAYSLEHKTHYPYLSRVERMRILERFDDSNEKVRRTYFPDRKTLFDSAFDDCIEYDYPGINESDLLDALVHSIKINAG